MTTPRKQVNTARFISLDSKVRIDSTIQLNKPFDAILPSGNSMLFNPGVLCFGSVSYTICKDYLSSNAHIYYKSNKSNEVFSNEYELFDKYPGERIYCCILSQSDSSEQKDYIFEYHFHAVIGTGGRMLSRTSLWLEKLNLEVEVEVNSAVSANRTVIKLNPVVTDLDPPVGLFFKSGSYDSVRTTLANYYDYRCEFDKCFVMNSPTTDWIPYLGRNNVIAGSNIVSYWDGVKNKSDSSQLSSALIKHDRSSSYGLKNLLRLNEFKSNKGMPELEAIKFRTISQLD